MLFPLPNVNHLEHLSNSNSHRDSADYSNNLSSRQSNLDLINDHLESIDKLIRDGSFTKACIEASKTAKLIDGNINKISTAEPNHNWNEIKQVLIEIPEKYCM